MCDVFWPIWSSYLTHHWQIYHPHQRRCSLSRLSSSQRLYPQTIMANGPWFELKMARPIGKGRTTLQAYETRFGIWDHLCWHAKIPGEAPLFLTKYQSNFLTIFRWHLWASSTCMNKTWKHIWAVGTFYHSQHWDWLSLVFEPRSKSIQKALTEREPVTVVLHWPMVQLAEKILLVSQKSGKYSLEVYCPFGELHARLEYYQSGMLSENAT